jgi:hypothetical protein
MSDDIYYYYFRPRENLFHKRENPIKILVDPEGEIKFAENKIFTRCFEGHTTFGRMTLGRMKPNQNDVHQN